MRLCSNNNPKFPTNQIRVLKCMNCGTVDSRCGISQELDSSCYKLNPRI